VLLAVAGLGDHATAQDANGPGAISLDAGFARIQASGTSGGDISSTAYGDSPTGPCRGWIPGEPQHTLTLATDLPYVALAAESADGGATTMVVEGPGDGDERWCSDDVWGVDPFIARAWRAGTSRVWVGSYAAGARHPYTLHLVGDPPPTGLDGAPGLSVASVDPTDPEGQLALGAGFLPDPLARSGVIGTEVPSSNRPCTGFFGARPNHLVNLTTDFEYLRMSVSTSGPSAVLAIGSAGQVLCGDGAVEGAFAAGTLRIWVGSPTRTTPAEYTIEFSELQH